MNSVMNDYLGKNTFECDQVIAEYEDVLDMVSEAETEAEQVALLNIIDSGLGDRFIELKEVVDAIKDSHVPNDENLLTEDGMNSECDDYLDDALRGVADWVVVDREATLEVLTLDYTEVDICGVSLYYR
jgi:hypothetical protein